MKTIFKPLLFAFMVIAGLKGFGQCPGNYYAYTVGTGGQVNFQNYYFYEDSGSSLPIFIWNFGDGSDTSHNSSYYVNHTYTAGGTYTVSLEELNTTSGCDSVYSQTIHVSLCAGAAQYSVSQIGFGDYAYTASNQSSFPGATYAWGFGDGGTSTSASPTHQFSASGNYSVVLLATDAAHSCIDTSYQDGMAANQIVTLCDLPIYIADTAVSFNPVNVNFQAKGGNGTYGYSWSFGDGGTGSAASNINHTYTASGNYNVNVTVSDAGGTGCTATASSSIDLNLCGVNNATFGNSGNGLTQSFGAYVYDSLGSNISSYDWTFAGATPSTGTGVNVSGITYPSAGSYTACVYLTTTGGCIDTICRQISITPPNYVISGTAGKGNGSGFIGTVYLIVQDSAGHLSLLDSTAMTFDTAGGNFNYAFYNVPVDTYYVKAALNLTDADYANYLPTYYGDVLTWGTATPVIITNNSIGGIDVTLTAGSNPGGPGFVGGYVSQGAGLVIGNAGNGNSKSSGDPLSGVQVNLLTSGNAAVAYTFTDANGHYKFANLALGSYKIYVEQLNKVPGPLDFTLTAENPVDSGANMTVSSHGTTGIDNVSGLQIMEVYPNPVVNNVQLQIGCQQDVDATLKIVDVLGRTNFEQKLKLTSGQNTAEVNMQAFAAGVYQLVIQTGKTQVAYKLVKAR